MPPPREPAPLLDPGDLYWAGSLEECDLCHDQFPMCWIIYTGRQYLCHACYYPPGQNPLASIAAPIDNHGSMNEKLTA